jgi:hypothetical protein
MRLGAQRSAPELTLPVFANRVVVVRHEKLGAVARQIAVAIKATLSTIQFVYQLSGKNGKTTD